MMKKNGAQQIVFQVDRTMKSWFAALKAYKKDSSKFRGRPRIPSYKKKDELNCLTYTYVDAKLQKDGTINISKKIKLPIHTNLKNFQQIRLVPKIGYVQVEIIYNKEVNELTKKLVEISTSSSTKIDKQKEIFNYMYLVSNNGFGNLTATAMMQLPLLFPLFRIVPTAKQMQ